MCKGTRRRSIDEMTNECKECTDKINNNEGHDVLVIVELIMNYYLWIPCGKQINVPNDDSIEIITENNVNIYNCKDALLNRFTVK